MHSPFRRHIRRIRSTQRGVSLIEGMTASVVLLIGLMGVFQGMMVASRQNSLANLATRASGIASQVRVALDTLGRERVIGTAEHPGMLSGEACEAKPELLELAGGMEALQPNTEETWVVRCVFDLDAFESRVSEADQLLPGYAATDLSRYRRILVVVDKPDEASGVSIHQVTVVVSWMEMGQRQFVRQYVGFYDSGSLGNDTHIEI